jgi:hypothetical protein
MLINYKLVKFVYFIQINLKLIFPCLLERNNRTLRIFVVGDDTSTTTSMQRPR